MNTGQVNGSGCTGPVSSLEAGTCLETASVVTETVTTTSNITSTNCNGGFNPTSSSSGGLKCDLDQPSLAESSPEVLGSVIQSNEHENGDKNNCVQLRTSARVSKKMRLDFIASQAPPDKKDIPKEEDKLDAKPKRRPFELWPQEDKNTFFDALNEFGKDFDAIQKHFESKAKRKNLPEHTIKNKEQIRYFYYRTWHKISKHLRFPDEVKKVTQELYGLINFGELRKKIGGGVSEKNSLKLNELIYRGFTQIRIRGKTIRIKTPICRALRKLNQTEELADDIKLPPRVTVELRPLTNETWARVQAIGQNPRLQALLPLQHRLSTLLSFLEQRWRPRPIKQCERLKSELDEMTAAINSFPDTPSTSATPSANVATPHDFKTSLIDDMGCTFPTDVKIDSPPMATPRLRPKQILRVAPHANVMVTPLTINLSEYFTSTRLSLKSHEGRLGNHAAEELFNSMLVASNKGCGRRGTKRPRRDSSSEKKLSQPQAPTQQPQTTLDSSPEKSKDSTVSVSGPYAGIGAVTDNEDDRDKPSCPFRLFGSGVSLDASSSSADSGLKSPTGLKDENEQAASASGPRLPEPGPSGLSGPSCSQVSSINNTTGSPSETNEEVIKRVRKGWTLENAKAVTIGELYLMFGADSKIKLEYWWEDVTTPVKDNASEVGVKLETNQGSPISASSSVSDLHHNGPSISTEHKPEDGLNVSPSSEPLSLTLQKLLSLAKMYDAKTKALHCPCGHVCNGTPKATSQKPKAPRPVRISIDSDKAGGSDNATSSNNMVKIINSGISHSPVSSDGLFRRPLMPSPQFKPVPRPGTVDAFKAQLEKFRPRFCNRRGRPVSARKNVVVPRILPLLPKAPAGASVVTLQVIPQGDQITGEYLPIAQSPSVLNFTPVSYHNKPQIHSLASVVTPISTITTLTRSPRMPDLTASVGGISMPDLCQENHQEEARKVPSYVQSSTSRLVQDVFPPTLDTPVNSPPSISNLLDISLPSEIGLNSNPMMETSFSGLLSSDSRVSSSPPPASPSTLLKEDENQWLNSEVADFSLSSFLGHLESPVKSTTVTQGNAGGSVPEPSTISSDVETQMQCLMQENSLDYMAKFADLAAQIASEGTNKS